MRLFKEGGFVVMYLFGPVLSRRLGRSLGVDLLVPKTCSLNCVYCECGVTTNLSNTRAEWVPTQAVIAELDQVIAQHPDLDFITFSGAGEPTLHTGIGLVIAHLKSLNLKAKICLLTNATTLGMPGVSESLRGLDRIVPSLDAVSPAVFEKINRPAPGVTAESIIDGIEHFRKVSPETQMWLEIFVVPGVNDTEEEIAGFVPAVKRIAPDKIQLNSLDRPGCVDWIRRPSQASMDKFIHALEGICPVETVGKIDFGKTEVSPKGDIFNLEHSLLTICLRRPCTENDLSVLLGMEQSFIRRTLEGLVRCGALTVSEESGRLFYRTVEK